MAERIGIEWTDATVNFWWGCTKVGPGCDHCYAETWSARFGGDHWGVGAPRRKIKGAVALIQRLNGSSFFYENDRRMRVFIQSMSDLFDTEVPLAWFAEAWGKIVQCDRLDIQIVTKRISVVEKRLAAIGATAWPKHAGLLVTVCNQAEANRDIPRLLALKGKLGIPWVGVSAEPLLGPIDFQRIAMPEIRYETGIHYQDVLRAGSWSPRPFFRPAQHGEEQKFFTNHSDTERLDWVIVGGESGPTARPMHPDWARAIRDQCAAAGTAFFFKQHGEWIGVPDLRRLPGGGGPGFGVFDHAPYDAEAEAVRIGKARAGHLLDGVTHDAMPSCSGLSRASTPSTAEGSA